MTGGSGGLKSEAATPVAGGHAQPSGSPPVIKAEPPARLAEVVEEFAELPKELRLEALLDYSRRVPPLPSGLAGNRDAMEQVHECQTPFFVASEVAEDGSVTLWFDAPPEAPTTRGFAGILAEGLNGANVEEVLAVPDGFYAQMGLHEVVSPLRLRGIGAILARVKRQLRAQAAARGNAAPAAPS
jgi:cysteine desulfuration protein SufE